MLRSRRESHHSNGITGQKRLQRTSATKSVISRHHGLDLRCPLITRRPASNAASRELQVVHLPARAARPVLPGAVERIVVEPLDDLVDLAGAEKFDLPHSAA